MPITRSIAKPTTFFKQNIKMNLEDLFITSTLTGVINKLPVAPTRAGELAFLKKKALRPRLLLSKVVMVDYFWCLISAVMMIPRRLKIINVSTVSLKQRI